MSRYREQESQRVMERENDDHLSVAGGCSCERSGSYGKAVDDHHCEEDMHFAAEEMQDVYGVASCNRPDRWEGLFPECWDEWKQQAAEQDANKEVERERVQAELAAQRKSLEEANTDALAYYHDDGQSH